MAYLWETNDAVRLRDYIRENPRFMAAVRSMAKPITEVESIEARAMSGSERKGADDLIKAIEGLTSEPPKQDETPFIQ